MNNIKNIKFLIDVIKTYQLKDIFRQYLIKYPKSNIKYKSKNKKELLQLIKDNKIDITAFNIPENNPTPRRQINILKKYQTKAYDEEDQKKFLEEEVKNQNFALSARKEYVNKSGKLEKTSLQEHQVKFIKQFIYSNLQGAVVFHGVGSGKTLTAVVCSYWYLQLHPTNKVIVISPSALLFNFIEGMIQYGLQIEDNRYTFTTYDKYVRNPIIAKDCLLIVDEAHNMRTEMKMYDVKDPITNEDMGKESATNKRGYKIWKYGASHAHKILLLTGTAFVNTIYDIENLLAMIDQREPILRNTFADVLSSPSNIESYFSYRISYYPSPKSEFFPDRREELVPIYMTETMFEKYNNIRSRGKTGDNPRANKFFNDEKYASNTINDEIINPKIKWCIDKIKASKQKFIIYTGQYGAGISLLTKQLNDNKIKFVQITGKENSVSKELNKKYFNGYNFKSNKFFKSNDDPEFKKYINSDFRVLLISRAGAEGVDTINCQNLIILDHQWNDALSEQIIARAIRFKSHFGLPQKERYVNVYRLFLCFDKDKELFEKISGKNVDFIKLNHELKEEVRMQLKLSKIEDQTYLPSVVELKGLKIKTGDKEELYIPEDSVYEMKRKGWNKKPGMTLTRIGWDTYKDLKTDEARKQWRIKLYSEWFVKYGKPSANDPNFSFSSIDIRLYVLCKAKQANIEQFIKYFGDNIKLFEQYESKLLKYVIEEEKKTNKKFTDEEQSKIYASLLKNEKAELTKIMFKSTTRTTQEKLQQYFTNDKLAEELINKSNIIKSKTTVEILEPSAGDGQLIKPLCKLLKIDYNVDLVEIDKNNRIKLEELVKAAPNIIKLEPHKNFLTFIPSKRYDFVFMNPPFHLRKDSNGLLKHDVFDFHFIKRAYAMLKLGGCLMAITGKHWMNVDEMKKWYKSVKFEYEEKKNQMFSGVKVDVHIIKIIKESEAEDNEILDTQFYNTYDTEIGIEVMNAELSFKQLKESQTEKVKINAEPLIEF